uniref:Putative serine/threonine-protein kinase DDB_G0278665 n=1 Tax=Lygus hesperus TaxID=30085 RepID=A0A0A9YUN0_LYGHE
MLMGSKNSKKQKPAEEVAEQDNKSNRGSQCNDVDQNNTLNQGSPRGDATETLDEEIQCCQPKKSLFSKRKSTIPRRSRSRHGSLEKDEQLEEIKCMLKTLLQEKNEDEEDETEYLGRRSTMRKPSQYKPMSRRRHCSFIADECRKCSQKICLRCRMTLDSCCCGIPNFLFCKDCEGKTRAPDCSMKDPFACRKCDQKICLVCKEPLECCPCPKPNFLFCRMCDARMRTRCCIPAD